MFEKWKEEQQSQQSRFLWREFVVVVGVLPVLVNVISLGLVGGLTYLWKSYVAGE